MNSEATRSRDTRTRADSGLLEALHTVQAAHGYVSREEAMALSRRTNVPLARIFELLTFYSYFRVTKPGQITLTICQGTSCHLLGGPKLLGELEKLLGAKAGEATTGGTFQLNVVRCLGCCSRSPTLMIDGRAYSQVEPADLPKILRESARRAADKRSDRP